MTDTKASNDSLVYSDAGPRRALSLLLFCAWTFLVSVLIWNHVVWRDEVKAYTFAVQGHNVIAMWRGLRGDGHPALWHILIRTGHALVPHPQILQVVAFLVAFASLYLLAFRSPFSPFVLALLLSSRFAVWEYSVMARNYGISMLLLFLLAMAYPNHRHRGLLIGTLLFLLANCNVHSVLLVGAVLLFWIFDILWNGAGSRPKQLRNFLFNAAIAIAGVALCAFTVFPSIDDAAVIPRPHGIALLFACVKAVLFPFHYLVLYDPIKRALAHLPHLHGVAAGVFRLLLSVLLYGSALGLVRRPAALLAAWSSLLGLGLMFRLVYPGLYRHEALWLIFLIGLYWIAARQDAGQPSRAPPPVVRTVERAGCLMFVILLMLQSLGGLLAIAPLLLHKAPEGRSRELGRLIDAQPELRDAIIVADPDYLVETLPYYVSNPTYLLREHRYGNIVRFTRKATLSLSLDDILDQAQELHASAGKPVLILLMDRLSPSAPPQDLPEAYNWDLIATPGQVRRFQASTRRIAQFGPVSDNDETYDVYLID